MCIPMGGSQITPPGGDPNVPKIVYRPVDNIPLGDGKLNDAALAIKKRKQSIDEAVKAAGG